MSTPVLYDACVLYGNEVRDLLMRIAISEPARPAGGAPRGDQGADEPRGTRSARRRLRDAGGGTETPRPRRSPRAGGRKRRRGSGHSDQQPERLPGSDARTTRNRAKTPDNFVLDQISLDEGSVRDCVPQIARGRTRPPKTYEAVLNPFERAGLFGSAAALRD